MSCVDSHFAVSTLRISVLRSFLRTNLRIHRLYTQLEVDDFNKIFAQKFGMTPSEFRKASLSAYKEKSAANSLSMPRSFL